MGDWSILSYGLVAFVGVVVFLRLVANEVHAKCVAIDLRRERIDLELHARQRRQEQHPPAAESAATHQAGGDDSHPTTVPPT